MPNTRSLADRKAAKTQAEDRAAARKNLSAEQQIAALDARLGAGVGAAKERARLAGAK